MAVANTQESAIYLSQVFLELRGRGMIAQLPLVIFTACNSSNAARSVF